jgi:hypothetical protein
MFCCVIYQQTSKAEMMTGEREKIRKEGMETKRRKRKEKGTGEEKTARREVSEMVYLEKD